MEHVVGKQEGKKILLTYANMNEFQGGSQSWGLGSPRSPWGGCPDKRRLIYFTVISSSGNTVTECETIEFHTFSVIKHLRARVLSDASLWSNSWQFRGPWGVKSLTYSTYHTTGWVMKQTTTCSQSWVYASNCAEVIGSHSHFTNHINVHACLQRWVSPLPQSCSIISPSVSTTVFYLQAQYST